MINLKASHFFTVEPINETTLHSFEKSPLEVSDLEPLLAGDGSTLPVAIEPAMILPGTADTFRAIRDGQLCLHRFAGQLSLAEGALVQLEIDVVPPVKVSGYLLRLDNKAGDGQETVFSAQDATPDILRKSILSLSNTEKSEQRPE